MRDPARIYPLCMELARVWSDFPDMRLAQLICCLAGNRDPFYMEDDEVRKELAMFAKNGKPRQMKFDEQSAVSRLEQAGLKVGEILGAIANQSIRDDLEAMPGCQIDIYDSVSDLGANESDNELRDEDNTDFDFGWFLLSVPGSHRHLLVSGRVIEFCE